jgi:AraC-like DNA-binding protein
MGNSFHVVRPLEPPLAEVEDRVMFIPGGSELVVERPEARLLLVCDGWVRLGVDAQAIGEIGSGDIVVVPGPSRLVYRSLHERTESRLHVFRIDFDPSQFTCDPVNGWLIPIGGRHEETDFTVFIQNRFSRLRHLVRGQTPAIHALLEAIRHDADTEAPGFRHRVSARTRLIVALIGEQLARLDTGAPLRVAQSRHRWISEQVKEYLLTNASQPLTLEHVARHLRLTGEHLARVFKHEEGMTIFDFLRNLRIERAKALLASAQLSVDEIARDVGYTSSTLFCRNFKRTTGVTPTIYRERGGGRRTFSASIVRAAPRIG